MLSKKQRCLYVVHEYKQSMIRSFEDMNMQVLIRKET